MKLLKPGSRLWEPGGGNVKTQTALGDALFVWSSDRGSTPLGSTISTDIRYSKRACQKWQARVVLCKSRPDAALLALILQDYSFGLAAWAGGIC